MKQALDLNWRKLQGALEALGRARACRFREFVSPLVIVRAERGKEDDGDAEVRITLLMSLLGSKPNYESSVCRLQAGPLKYLDARYHPWYIGTPGKMSGWSLTFGIGRMPVRCGACDMCAAYARARSEERGMYKCREFLPARSALPGIARLDEARSFVDRVRAAVVAENL